MPVEASRPRLPFLAGFLAAFLSSFLPAASAADLASPLSFLRRFTMGLHGRRKVVRTFCSKMVCSLTSQHALSWQQGLIKLAFGTLQCLSRSHEAKFIHKSCTQGVLQARCIYRHAYDAHLLSSASWKHPSGRCQHHTEIGKRGQHRLKRPQTQIDNTQAADRYQDRCLTWGLSQVHRCPWGSCKQQHPL